MLKKTKSKTYTYEQEKEPSVRVVLGPFVFGYIHLYMGDNGRLGRFLMNVILAGDGYPWAVVPLADYNGDVSLLRIEIGCDKAIPI